jgi:hypothetical protein
MSKTLFHKLFGSGKIPKRYAPTLRAEGIVLLDEGIGGTITLKKFKAPGRRHSWKRTWFTGSVVISRRTFAAFVFAKPVVFVPLDDERFSKLHCSAEGEDKLLVAFDAAAFNDKWSGTVECRFRTSKSRRFLDRLAKRPE